MKKTNRQLVLGSLQPLLFCIGMYFVVLIFSVFVCSSLYRVMKTKKQPLTQQQTDSNKGQSAATTLVAIFK